MKQATLLKDDCGNCQGMCEEEKCNCPCHYPNPFEGEEDMIEQPPFKSSLDKEVDEDEE